MTIFNQENLLQNRFKQSAGWGMRHSPRAPWEGGDLMSPITYAYTLRLFVAHQVQCNQIEMRLIGPTSLHFGMWCSVVASIVRAQGSKYCSYTAYASSERGERRAVNRTWMQFRQMASSLIRSFIGAFPWDLKRQIKGQGVALNLLFNTGEGYWTSKVSILQFLF